MESGNLFILRPFSLAGVHRRANQIRQVRVHTTARFRFYKRKKLSLFEAGKDTAPTPAGCCVGIVAKGFKTGGPYRRQKTFPEFPAVIKNCR